jgi:hypothetical protein
MTARTIALRVLDGIFVMFTTVLILWIAGLPVDWIADLVNTAPGEFHWFAMFVVFAALRLMRAIATSDSTPNSALVTRGQLDEFNDGVDVPCRPLRGGRNPQL